MFRPFSAPEFSIGVSVKCSIHQQSRCVSAAGRPWLPAYTKTLLADDTRAVFGFATLDMCNLFLNDETGHIFYSREKCVSFDLGYKSSSALIEMFRRSLVISTGKFSRNQG